MKKYISYVFVIISIFGIFFIVSTKQVHATDPLGSCVWGDINNTTTQAACTSPSTWSAYGYCVLSNGTVQSGWTNTTCISDNHGISWSTNPPALGWCDVAGDQVYSGWTSASCNVHSPRGNWTTSAPAVGWCTLSGTTQAVSGWTQYECTASSGTWSATNPNQTLSTGTNTGTGGTGGGTGTSTGTGVSTGSTGNGTSTTTQTYCDYGPNSNGVGEDIEPSDSAAECIQNHGTPTSTVPVDTSSVDLGTIPSTTTGSSSSSSTTTGTSGTSTSTQTYCDYGPNSNGVGEDIEPSDSNAECTQNGGNPTTTPPSSTTGSTSTSTSTTLPGGLVPCDNVATKCDFNQLMTLINKVINFILYSMVIPIAAIMFAYAGFLMVTAGGEAAHARTKAKSIFTNAVIGLIIAVACWLIIKTILSILGFNGSWIGF